MRCTLTTCGPMKYRMLCVCCLLVVSGCAALQMDRPESAAPHLEWTFQAGTRTYSSPVVGEFSSEPGLEILTTSSEERRLLCLSAAREVLWTYDDIILRLTSTPTVADIDADGRLDILIATRESGVVCLSDDGTERWKVPVEGGIPWGSVTAADCDGDGKTELFWISRTGLLECRDADGLKIWDFQTPRPPGPLGPVAVGDLDGDGLKEIVTCGGPKTVYCVDLAGDERWRFEAVAPFSAAPVIADITGDAVPEVLAVSIDGLFYCLSGASGNVVWSHRTFRARIDTTVAVGDIDADGRQDILYGDGLGYLYCLDADGEERWFFKADDWIESAPALGDVDGDGEIEVVFGSADGNLYCLSPSGQREWQFPTGKRIAASPTLCDYDRDGDVDILIPSHNGNLYCLSFGGRWDPKRILWPFRRSDFQQTGCVLSE